jgi:hypothetical protein
MADLVHLFTIFNRIVQFSKEKCSSNTVMVKRYFSDVLGTVLDEA